MYHITEFLDIAITLTYTSAALHILSQHLHIADTVMETDGRTGATKRIHYSPLPTHTFCGGV